MLNIKTLLVIIAAIVIWGTICSGTFYSVPVYNCPRGYMRIRKHCRKLHFSYLDAALSNRWNLFSRSWRVGLFSVYNDDTLHYGDTNNLVWIGPLQHLRDRNKSFSYEVNVSSFAALLQNVFLI